MKIKKKMYIYILLKKIMTIIYNNVKIYKLIFN